MTTPPTLRVLNLASLAALALSLSACDADSNPSDEQGAAGKADETTVEADETMLEACEIPGDYREVTGSELFLTRQDFTGRTVAVRGTARHSFPTCTELACPEDSCCNACSAGISLDTGVWRGLPARKRRVVVLGR